MGAVYRATHVMLGKPVALKLIRPEIVTSPEMVRRFQREARAASLLSHPNIVTIHDLGQLEDGTLYLAMELCAGMSLKDLIVAEGPLALRRAVRLCRAIAGALALAHKHRIVHRDLKSHNVMIARDAEGHETPKLLDFGIAKAVETDGATLTATGMVLGTPVAGAGQRRVGRWAQRSLLARDRLLRDASRARPVRRSVHPFAPRQAYGRAPAAAFGAAPRHPAGHRVDRSVPVKDPARRFQSAEDLSAALAALVPVGNAPTLAAGTIPSPGLRAPNATAGATITDERPSPPAAGPTLGGYPAGYPPYPAGLDDGPETGAAYGHAEHEQAWSRLARRRGGPARDQRRATALDAIKARSAAQDSGCRGPRRIGPAAHERARISEVARTRGRCSAAQCAIPSLCGSEAGRKRGAPGRRARGHDGARAARRADAARSASIRPSLTSTATASPCRESTAPATMASTTARCEAPTASTASRAPSSASAALPSPPSAIAPARLRGALRLPISA
jgi:protein kinase-like protein